MFEPMDELRTAVRRRLRSPVATFAAVSSVALGVCAVSVAFSALSATLLRPIPGASPSLLRVLGAGPSGELVVSFPEFEAMRDAAAFDGLAAERVNQTTVVVDGEPGSVGAAAVSPSYFEVLGVRMARGSSLAGDDGSEGAVLVVSDAFRRTVLGADDDPLGRSVTVGGLDATVVGVADPDFSGAFPGFRTDVWISLDHVESVFPRDGSPSRMEDRFLNVLGTAPRAEPGVLEARLDGVARALADDPAFPPDRTFEVEPARGGHPSLRPIAGTVFGGLLALTVMLLVVVCANVANLELARGIGRTSEIAVRLALGASRSAVSAGFLMDGALLGLTGASLGLGAASGITALLSRARLPADVPVGLDLEVDVRTGLFALGVGVLSGIAFTLLPALRGARITPTAVLGTTTSGGDHTAVWPQRILVATQLVVSTALLLAGAALVRGLSELADVEPGFDRDRIVTVETSAPGAMVESDGRAFWEAAAVRAEAIPGVDAVSLGLFVHLGGRSDRMRLRMPGAPADSWPLGAVHYSIVDEGFFDVLGMALVAGRDFDGEVAAEVVLNHEAAGRLWPNESGVGRDLEIEDRDGRLRRARVVGVVETARYRSLGEEPTPFAYLPLSAWYRPDLVLHLRVGPGAEREEVVSSARERLSALADRHPWVVRPMSAHATVAGTLAALIRRLLLVCGTIGLVVSAVGVYGVVAYVTERRTAELAIRIALGASVARIDRMVVVDAAWVTGLSVVAGSLLGRLMAGVAGAMLPGLGGVRPSSYVGVGVAIVAVALLAAWLPSRRITRSVHLREVLQP